MTSEVRTESRAAQNRVEALRNRIRAKVLRLLISQGPSSPSKMAKVLEERLDNVNYHVKRLAELGCAELVDERRSSSGPAEHIYRATERYLVETEEWEALPAAIKDHLSAEFAQAHIDDLVLGFRSYTLGTHEHFHLTQTRILVDEQGRDELLEIHERARLESLEAQDRAAKRLLGAQGNAVNMSSLLACFEVPAEDEKPSAQNS